MAEYNPETLRAQVAAGYKGGPFFANLIQHPQMTIVEVPETKLAERYGASATPQIPIQK